MIFISPILRLTTLLLRCLHYGTGAHTERPEKSPSGLSPALYAWDYNRTMFRVYRDRISIRAKFHRSVVGAVSFRVTPLPAEPPAPLWLCTQKLSPTEARYSSTF